MSSQKSSLEDRESFDDYVSIFNKHEDEHEDEHEHDYQSSGNVDDNAS